MLVHTNYDLVVAMFSKLYYMLLFAMKALMGDGCLLVSSVPVCLICLFKSYYSVVAICFSMELHSMLNILRGLTSTSIPLIILPDFLPSCLLCIIVFVVVLFVIIHVGFCFFTFCISILIRQ